MATYDDPFDMKDREPSGYDITPLDASAVDVADLGDGAQTKQPEPAPAPAPTMPPAAPAPTYMNPPGMGGVPFPMVQGPATAPPQPALDVLHSTWCCGVPLYKSFNRLTTVMMVLSIAACIFAFPVGILLGIPTLILAIVARMNHRSKPQALWPVTMLMTLYIVHAVLTGLSTLFAAAIAANHCNDIITDPKPDQDTHDVARECEGYVFVFALYIIVATAFTYAEIVTARFLLTYRRACAAYGGPPPSPDTDLAAVLAVRPAGNTAPVTVGFGVPVSQATAVQMAGPGASVQRL